MRIRGWGRCDREKFPRMEGKDKIMENMRGEVGHINSYPRYPVYK